MLAEVLGTAVHPSMDLAELRAVCDRHQVAYLPAWGPGKLVFELYDACLQPTIVDPVFLCGYPLEVSPLARQTASDPTMVDRFELVIDAREFANGYSELNDPDEQEARFRAEAAAREAGDLESHPADHAFVRALQYGLPPTAGVGIGVDRLVMLLGEVSSIRDVILFPVLRPEAGATPPA
jgi:lysyl-tRNA synthetase class 2